MKYKQGIVYRVICLLNNIQYVGSTTQSLTKRFSKMKQEFEKYYMNDVKKGYCSINKYFKEYGIENFKIIPIKKYKVVDKIHLQAYEQLYISKFKCVNDNNTIYIKKHSAKQYYQKFKEEIKSKVKEWSNSNKNKIRERKKKYREEHKDDIKEKKQVYYEKNKEKINNNRKETYICPCSDKPLTKSHKNRHEKTLKHMNFSLSE